MAIYGASGISSDRWREDNGETLLTPDELSEANAELTAAADRRREKLHNFGIDPDT